MKDEPLVSILAPCYNVEAFLPQCLDSIINQTYRNLQIVLIDDGSKDNTWSILQKYAAKYPQTLQTLQTPWIEIYHQENQGVATTRNHLLDKIKGDYFLFVDSDDWIELDMVEFLVSKAQSNDVEMVVCGNVINDTRPVREFKEERWTQEHAVKEFLRHVSFGGSLWNKLTNVTLLHNEPKFHRGISYGEDALFCWELLQNAKNVLVTDKQLYHYRMNDSSISHAKWSPEKMGSGHVVWEILEKSAKELWPDFADIASTSFAISDMWQLYYASRSKHHKDKYIKMYQSHVRKDLPLIRKADTISVNKKFFAEIVARSYTLGGILARIS